MTLTTSQLKLFFALIGFWFILSCSALYGLGRSHGRAENDCTRAEKQVEELRAAIRAIVSEELERELRRRLPER